MADKLSVVDFLIILKKTSAEPIITDQQLSGEEVSVLRLNFVTSCARFVAGA